MTAVALIGNETQINRVYGNGRRERIAREFNLYPEVITPAIIADKRVDLAGINYLFSTWGMPALTTEDIAGLSSLEAVFYGAGSVQGFARPLLDAGVKVFSAWAANAVPVAEFTVAQILLANKGVLRATRSVRSKKQWQRFSSDVLPGNYEATVSLLGAGMIGRRVIELLAPYSLDILVFDPFLSEDKAVELGVEKVELDEAFSRGTVVSNHLANLPETRKMLKREHFVSMAQHATFINTGRGATLDQEGMISVLSSRPDLTAILDVSYPEPPEDDSPLYRMDNVFLTPHIAGSIGAHEVLRMADYMIEEALALQAGRPHTYEVSLEMLKTMA